MVASNDMELIRIRVIMRPVAGLREACVRLMQAMLPIGRGHARDYEFYVDPRTDDLICWETFESIAAFTDHVDKMPKDLAGKLYESVEVRQFQVYATDERQQEIRRFLSGWIDPQPFRPVL